MAVVQNSADGLYMAMPSAFDLTSPTNFACFQSVDADLGDPQHQKEMHLLQFDHHCGMSPLQNCQNTEAHTGAQVADMGPLQNCQNAEAHTGAQVEICDQKEWSHQEQDQNKNLVALQEEKHVGSINCQNTEARTRAQVEKQSHYEQDQDNNLMAVQQEEEHVGSIHGPASLPAPSEQMAIGEESNPLSSAALNGSNDATFHPNDVVDASHDTAFHPIDGNGSSSSSPPPVDEQKRYDNDGIQELEDLLSKLNPLAEEFVPPSRVNSTFAHKAGTTAGKQSNHKKKPEYIPGRHHNISRTSRAQRDDCIRRTVYVSDIDQQVTEEQLAALFITCGQVVDCRICGDPNSVLRFAFVEFTDEVSARAALNLSGTMLGYYPVRVLPSKTAIIPVNPTLLPRSEYEREMCERTIYCTNIDKKVTQADVKLFFESLCGEVLRLRLLGDYQHSTRIAFVEFAMAQSAVAALNCSGAILGSLPIRVSPSKTPVRPRSPHRVP